MSHLRETKATIASRPQFSQLASEMVGTALLIVAVVGSGIMAESLSGDVGVQLLANSAATVGALYALITMFGTISGAHFNPVVSLMAAARGQLSWASLPLYSLAQLVGGCLGTALANLMFEQPAWEWSTKLRDGSGIWLGFRSWSNRTSRKRQTTYAPFAAARAGRTLLQTANRFA